MTFNQHFKLVTYKNNYSIGRKAHGTQIYTCICPIRTPTYKHTPLHNYTQYKSTWLKKSTHTYAPLIIKQIHSLTFS